MDTSQHRRRWTSILQTLGRCLLLIAANSKLQAIPDHPANTIHSPNAVLMLARRLRRQLNINPALVQCIVFDGQLLFLANTKHLHNNCTTSAQRLRRLSNIVQMFCVYWIERSPANTRRWTSAGLMLGQHRRSLASIGLALGQRRVCWECWQVFRTKTEFGAFY